MSGNTVEFVIKANLSQFTQAIRQGRAQFEVDVRGMAKAAGDSGKQIDTAFSTLGIRSMRDIQAEIRRVESAYGRMGKSATISGREKVRAAQAAKAKIVELRRELRGGVGDTDKFGNSISSATRRLLAFAAAYISLRQGIGLVKQVLDVGGDFERLGVQLASIMGSIAEGEKATAWIKNFVLTTPFQLQGVTEAFVQLRAFGMDPMDGTMQAIVDQTSLLGGSQEMLISITGALGKAWAKEKLQGEEILRLIERGVPVWSLLAKATGKTTQELQKMSEQGKLGRDVIKSLIDEMGKGAAGAATAQMATWNGIVSNLKDNWASFLDLVAQSGALDHFKDQVAAINIAMTEMAETGELQEIATEVSEAIISIASAIKSGVVFIYEWREALAALAAVAIGLKLTNLAIGIAALIAPTAAVGGAATGAAAGITLMNKAMKGTAVALALWSGKQVWDLVDAYLELKRTQEGIADRRQTDAARLVELVGQQEKYANVQTLTAEEIVRLSETEQQAYRDRIRAAKDFYDELRDVSSRVEADVDPAAGPSEEALLAARQARVMREAYDKVKKLQEQREKSMADHRDTVADIKKDETDKIKKQLTEQLKSYDEANKKLLKAQEIRKQLEQRGKEFEEEFSQPKKQDETSTENTVNIYNQLIRTKDALDAGDFGTATAGAELLEDRLRRARDEGTLTSTEMQRLAKEVRNVWDGIGEGREIEADQELEEAQIKVDELVSKADFLKKLEIGFNEDAAEQSVEQLRKVVQKKLDEKRPVMSVVIQEIKEDERVERLLTGAPKRAAGGPIDGPGTETSDSILARVSRGEYVLRAAAVRKYGRGFISALNRMALPRFATGGLVAGATAGLGGSSIINNLRMPEMPAAAGGSGSDGTPVNLYLDGKHFPVTASANTAEEMKRSFARESLKRGGRVAR